jgi:hypothetical protein
MTYYMILPSLSIFESLSIYLFKDFICAYRFTMNLSIQIVSIAIN